MSNNTFVLSDESLNSQGIKVLTSGINLERFLKNPVMLYMHQRETVIGRWENIRIEGDRLLGDAIFNENSVIGESVQKQVIDGFLRAASIGIEVVSQDVINGENVVTNSVLVEISIVDIPGNSNAVKLHKGNHCRILRLSNLPPHDNEILSKIKAVLELNEASDEDVLNALKSLKRAEIKNTPNVPESVEKAFELNLISDTEVRRFCKSDKFNKETFIGYCNKLLQHNDNQIEKEINKLLKYNKILNFERSIFEDIAKRVNIEDFKRLSSCIPSRISIIDTLQGGKDYDKETWGLKEYRKYKPEELNNNPALYEMLLEKEGEIPQNRSLDWYRKNNPQYLKDNPQEYKQLLELEKIKK